MHRITRAKNFVSDHRIAFAFGTGFAVGVAIIVLQSKGVDTPSVLTRLKVTSDELQMLIDNPEGVLSFNVNPWDSIWIVNAASKELA